MGKYIVEFIGTFFLVLTVGMTAIHPEAGALAPIAIGSALMVMVYAGGYLSGAHYNPAVTLAVYLRGRCARSDVPAYMLAQVAGAIVAAFVVAILRDPSASQVTAATVAARPALIPEFVFAFALAWVVLNVTTARATAGNSYYGLAIGFAVTMGAFAEGSIPSSAFNPAVAV